MVKKNMISKDKLQDNNFNILRLFFAIFVIVTHSFVLSGNSSSEILGKLTNNQINFSYLGLRGFFIISGFLIFKSFERSSGLFDYLWKRFLRIFPGLLCISLISIFIISPFLTNLSFADFFTNKNTYLVFSQSIDLFFEKNLTYLPGVFESNIFTPEINGSLWTISYEFLFYFGLVFLFISKNKVIHFLLILIAIISFIFFKLFYIDPWFKYEYFIFNSEIGVKSLYDFGLFFLSGSLFASLNYENLKRRYHKIILLIVGLLILILLFNNLFINFFHLLLVPGILSLGLLNASKFDITKKMGDISYGIYLSGFFIQQFYLSIYPFNPFLLTLITLMTSILYGFLSWVYIEKPALSYKNKFTNI